MSRRDETPPVDGEAFASVLMAARANAPWAFQRLFTTYAPRVKAYVQTNGAAEPDEITNDVFLAAFQALSRFEGDESGFRSWLFTIARRRVIDEHRKRSRRVVTVGTEHTTELDGAGGDVETEALEAGERGSDGQPGTTGAPDSPGVDGSDVADRATSGEPKEDGKEFGTSIADEATEGTPAEDRVGGADSGQPDSTPGSDTAEEHTPDEAPAAGSDTADERKPDADTDPPAPADLP